MLGHAIFEHFRGEMNGCDVRVTLRADLGDYPPNNLFTESNAFTGVDVRSTDRLVEVLSEFRPEVVINAAGIVKQRNAAKLSIPCLEMNALLPHRLAIICRGIRARLIHLSTDCVFSGRKGNYQELDQSDAEDLYGKSKFLGELQQENCLTIRTSSVGHELGAPKGLLGWFLSQSGQVKGFPNAIYSGLTSPELARVISRLVFGHPLAEGLYHVGGDPISKFELLHLFKDRFQHDVVISPDSTFECDRSFDSRRFRREFSYEPPTWRAMVKDLPNN